MRKLFAFDLVLLGYFGILSIIVIIARPPWWGLYLGFHAVVTGIVALVSAAEGRWGGRFWTFVRHWYVVPLIPASFRELHYLIPEVRPFDGYPYDRALAAVDARWFGDVDGFFLSLANPLFIDVLHLCYWSYFLIPFVPGIMLYARGELVRLREFVAVLLSAYYLSYLAYFLAPSIGPHHFFETRPPELDGAFLGGYFHAALMALELEMADAFPSGHTLVSLVVLVMAWRLCRRGFWWTLVPATGIVLATMALRYHYVVDVVAGAGLLPVVVLLGRSLHAAREGAVTNRD